MTRASFEMDNLMPDWTDDFDFGAFLSLPPDDVDQGVEDGPCMWDDSGHGSDSMPNLCDERPLDIPWHSHGPSLLDHSQNAEAHQSTNFQLQTNNASPGFGYGAKDLYGDKIGASGCIRPASATVLKTTGSQMIAMGNYREVCTIPSEQEPSPSLASGPASHDAPGNHCTCISCLNIKGNGVTGGKCRFPSCLHLVSDWSKDYWHEESHYGQRGKFTCLEQDCQAVTKNFSELKRHYKKHCTNPDKEQFPCPVLWCKYSGNNGFARKDKLQSHYRNIHEGKPGPVKAGRVIKPAPLKPRVSGLGNSPGKQND